jgi:hypothetical protein
MLSSCSRLSVAFEGFLPDTARTRRHLVDPQRRTKSDPWSMKAWNRILRTEARTLKLDGSVKDQCAVPSTTMSSCGQRLGECLGASLRAKAPRIFELDQW